MEVADVVEVAGFPATTSERLEHIAAVDQQVEVGEVSQGEVAVGPQAKY